MDRYVFIAVALAVLFATQVQAGDPYFNAHCEESQTIVASVQTQTADTVRVVVPARVEPPAGDLKQDRRPGPAQARKIRKSRA